MTVRSSTNIHFDEADVTHTRHAGKYATLDIGFGAEDTFYLHFENTAQVDKVIAELVALRAEMTGDDARRLTAKGEAKPLVVSDSTIAQAEALAGDIEAGTWPAPAPSGMQSPAPVVRVIGHPFDAGEGSREISGPGRELLAAAIAEQDAADEAAAAMSGYCPATTGPDEELDVTLYCDRQAVHAGSHHAPCPDKGSEVAWSDEAAASVTA